MNRRLSLLGGLAAIGFAAAGAGFFLRRRGSGAGEALPQMDAEAFAAAHMPLVQPEGPLKVYHLGHSLVGRDMPAMLAQMAPDGHDYASQLGWGATLRSHWLGPDQVPGFAEENTHAAHRPAKEAIGSGDYDAVVVTEMVELKDAIRWHNSSLNLANWASFAHEARPDTRFYLYETWHQLDDEHGWLERIDADSDALWRDELIRRAMSNERAGVIYRIAGGPALAAAARAAEQGELSGIDSRDALFARTAEGKLDPIHLSDLGNYVIALTHYAVLYQRNPVGLPVGVMRADGSPADAFQPDAAERIQALVWDVVSNDALSGLRP